jgi:hypothetical protein
VRKRPCVIGYPRMSLAPLRLATFIL